jgi:GTP-binding protein HflX
VSLIERAFTEKIVVVGVTLAGGREEVTEQHLDELAELVATAGADVVERVHQRRPEPDPATYIGKGKANELREISEQFDADTVVFDDELSPAQSRNLEKILGRTAIDRTAVILDIFAQNASSEEGKAQVELALLRYRLPRLRGRGWQLSQQAGRIGTRGPGETQLEVDRRRLLRRIHKLEAELAGLERRRRLQRQGRHGSRLAKVSIVGYTNAGKSTLLNALTGAGVVADERLFATLDPRTRRFSLPGGEPVLISDTVGFVRKLPHQLVEAFHSTLEVVNEADLILHVVDASAPRPEDQMDAVWRVLEEIGAADITEVMVFNKADLAPGEAAKLAERHPGGVAISAQHGDGLGALVEAVAHQLRRSYRTVELAVPYSKGDVLAALHREGEVLATSPSDGATLVRATLPVSALARFADFEVSQ